MDKSIRHKHNYERKEVTGKPGKSSYEKLPSYPLQVVWKRPEVALQDAKDADKWKTRVINMLETRFASIILKSSTDVGHANLHTVNIQVNNGSPCFQTIHYSTKVSKFQ